MDYTKGPWVVGYWSGQCHMEHQHGCGQCKYDPLFRNSFAAISQAQEGGRLIISADEDIRKADVRLIAAAPELYEALKEAEAMLRIYYVKNSDGSAPTLERVADALAKAEGRS